MPSALPTESAIDKSVKDFGIGTYDSQSDSSGSHGEDSEASEPIRRSLPDAGPPDVQCPDRYLSYPDEPGSRTSSWWKNIFSAADLPGSYGDPGHSHPDMSSLEDRITSVAESSTGSSELPSDSDNPPARSDYFDRTFTGGSGGIWPKEDSGAYVSQECVAESGLPGVLKNEESMDNNLQALGNWQSGYEIEDISGPQGFPSTDFSENVNFDRSDLQNGGTVIASEGYGMNRMATNIHLVTDLTNEFLKEFGKKGLTKRHVLSFLQKKGEPQFLSSDIIRCLKLSHEIYVKDVLDEFPVHKKASSNDIVSIRDCLIRLEIDNIRSPEVSSAFRRSAADLSKVIADLERIED
jgi:hypothetical protein